MADRLAMIIMKPKFWAQGAPKDVVGVRRGQWTGHYHGNAMALMALLCYASVTNNYRVKQFVRNSYEFFRNLGIPRIGWFISCSGHENPPHGGHDPAGHRVDTALRGRLLG